MELDKHNLASDPPSRELLEALVDENQLEEALNRRSPAYKELGLAEKKLTKKEAIELILADPNLMKRPLVVRRKKRVFGWLPDDYRRVFGL